MIAEKLLEVSNLKTYFYTEEGRVTKAVDGVSFDIGKGETVAIVGESGSGKSVTSLSIMGLVPKPIGDVVEGSITFEGRNILDFTEKQMTGLRGNDMAMIFQEPMTSLNPVFTVGNQIAEAIMKHQGVKKSVAYEKVIQLLKMVGFPRAEETVDEYPHQLSGGMRQRAMIAMAMSCEPKLLIADEPTTALDVTIQAQIIDLMKEVKQTYNSSILLITHDLGVVAEMADRVIVMYGGQVVEETTADRLFKNPLHPYTDGLLASMPKIDEERDRLEQIPGSVPPAHKFPVGCRFAPRCSKVMPHCTKVAPELIETDLGHKVRCFLYDSEPIVVDSENTGKKSQHNEKLVEIKGLKKYFPIKNKFLKGSRVQVKAVDDISFDIYKGETLGIVGESGSGKSTLGRTLLRLLTPNDGQIIFDGQDITRLRSSRLRKYRRDMQMIFQDPFASLNTRMTVGDILTEPMLIHGLYTPHDRIERAREALETVGLPPEAITRYPHEFSGGQRQRIGIARAISINPKLIIADEPVSALDVSVQSQVLNLMADLQKEFDLTYLFIAHDLSVVKHFCDRVGVMYLGKMMEIAPKKSLYDDPLHPYSQALLSAVPIPNPEVKRERILLQGDLPSPSNPPSGCVFRTRCFKAHERCQHEVPQLTDMGNGRYVACHLYTN